MQFIKLIDRTPNSWHLKLVRFVHTKMPIHNIEQLLSERPNSLPSIVEWLDETQPLPVDAGEQSAEQILKDIIKNDTDLTFPTETSIKDYADAGQWYVRDDLVHKAMQAYRQLPVQNNDADKMDKELDLVHECLTELYSIDAAVPIIKKYLAKIKNL